MSNEKTGITFGFIVPCYVNTKQAYESLIKCIDCIRSYHTEKIILLNNRSPIEIKDIKNKYKNVDIHTSPVSLSGEFNGYLWFYENHAFDKAVILHDSMYLNKKMLNIENVKKVQFIKYFTDHINDWSRVKEPATEYNRQHNIITHDDLILHIINRILKDKNEKFRTFARNLYQSKRQWVGCYGIMSIIDYSFLCELQNKTNIIDIGKDLRGKRDRIAMESIYPISILFLEPLTTLKNAYDGPWRIGNTYRPVTDNFTKISLGR